jgi:hypothetical protein
MGGIDLLAEAQAAGLIVKADGDRLIIEGPKGAAGVAQKLIQHKAEVMAILVAAERPTPPQPLRRPRQAKPGDATQARPVRVTRTALQWPTRPQKSQHHILGPRLRWTEKSKRYQIEKFPEDGDPIFIVLVEDGGWRVIDHRRTLKAAQSCCRRHSKQTKSTSRARAA